MMPDKPAWSVIGCLLCCMSAGNAFAEISYKIPNGFGWKDGVPIRCLGLESVEKDLGLDPHVAYQLDRWTDAVSAAAYQELTGVRDKIQRRQVLQKAQRTVQPTLDSILSEGQVSRLHQIDLQMEGLDALSDPKVADTLRLSSTQKASIRAIHQRMLKEEIASVKGGRKADDLSMRDRDKLLLEILTPEQKETWHELRGREFDPSSFLPKLRFRDRALDVWNVSFSPDGKRLASSNGSNIFLWDSESGALLSTMRGHEAQVTSVCFGPDGRWILSASTDRTVRSWDVESGKNIVSHGPSHMSFNGRFLPGLGNESFRNIAVSPDGTRLAFTRGTTLAEYHRISPLAQPLFNGSIVMRSQIDKQSVWSVAYGSDGKRQACGRMDGSVLLYHSGAPTKIVAGKDAILSVAFSPDGKLLATASVDGTVKLWKVEGGSEVASLPSHPQGARCVTFSADSSLVASSGDDGFVRVTSLENPSAALALEHKDIATGVSIHVDGKRIATAGSDGCVRVWSMEGNELLLLKPDRAPNSAR